MSHLYNFFQALSGQHFIKLKKLLSENKNIKSLLKSNLPTALFIILIYFFIASIASRFILHNQSIHHLAQWLPENSLLLLTFFCLLIGIPSSLVVDPTILTLDPVYGILKLATITACVAASQIIMIKLLRADKKLFNLTANAKTASFKTILLCLIIRFVPIMPFGVATLFLYFKLKKIKTIAIITFFGSIIYYSLLAFVIHKSA